MTKSSKFQPKADRPLDDKVKSQKLKAPNGFTLIEMLVVITVVMTVGIVVTGILFSAFRGSNKSKAFNNIENNGNYVIAQVSRLTRFSKKFDGVSTDGLNFVSNCAQVQPPAPTPSPAPIAYSHLRITSYDGGQTTFSCSTSTISSNSASMLDTALVSLESCRFTCSQSSPSDFPIISIQFTLTQFKPTGAPQFLPEQAPSANFQTSITPRNINR